MEAVERQLEGVIAVLRAEQQRRMAGSVIRRPTWKNLVFAGAAGSGKSRASAAVCRVYRELGLLSDGRLNGLLRRRREAVGGKAPGMTGRKTGSRR